MSQVKYEVRGSIVVVTIDRPEARNALNQEVRAGITDSVQQFESDDSLKVLVLTGAGDVAFSAGADLKEMADNNLKVPASSYLPNLNSTKPIIAAVNGYALGGGFYLAQQADLVIASEYASFGITEARYGRGAPWALQLPLLIPPRVALQMMMSAEPIGALRAFEIGLVNEVVPANALMVRSLELAEQIAALAPLTVRAAKAMVREVLSHSTEASQSAVADIWRKVYLSDDAQEGPRAFSEKRPPKWSGK